MADQAIFGQAKLLNHPGKILAWMQDASESLITVELDLTNRCNNLCPGCAGGRSDTVGTLTLDEVRTYLDAVVLAGAKAVIFTGGGEPLVHRHVLDAIRYARQVGLEVGLITNGLALTPELSAELVTLCMWIRVSLDAADAAGYQRTHGIDRFDVVLAHIEALVQQKRAVGSECTVGLGYLTGAQTLTGMEGFLQVATALGVDYAQFRPFHGDWTDIRAEYARLKAIYPVATASIQKYGHFTDTEKRPYTACYGRDFVTVIGADANVYVCCHMRGNAKYVLGNLRQESFSTIWARRHEVTIDFADCPLFCRVDECNRLLSELKKPKTHINFL